MTIEVIKVRDLSRVAIVGCIERYLVELAALGGWPPHTPAEMRRHHEIHGSFVIAAHLAVLAESLGGWPRSSPAELLRDLAIGEASSIDHVDAVRRRLTKPAERN